eukprot:TCONS_00053349-protein
MDKLKIAFFSICLICTVTAYPLYFTNTEEPNKKSSKPTTVSSSRTTLTTTATKPTTTTISTTRRRNTIVEHPKRSCSYFPLCTEVERNAKKCLGCYEQDFMLTEFWGICFCYEQPPMIAMP